MQAPQRPTAIGSLSLLAALIGFLSNAQAQDYPNRPVRLITDSAPGGSIDVPVRIIAEGLSRVWRQQAVVINQPGAGGAIAARTAASATPDGYTFGVIAASAFVALPGSADNLPVQVPRDFTPVGYLGGRADVHHGGAMAQRKNPAGRDRAGQAKTRRIVLRRQRHRPFDSFDRRTSAKAGAN
jgi:hypothetical protein